MGGPSELRGKQWPKSILSLHYDRHVEDECTIFAGGSWATLGSVNTATYGIMSDLGV